MNVQRALIVEDYPQVIFTLRPLLRTRHFLVDSAGTMSSAVRKIHQRTYDLVILDRNLPDGDGVELLQTIDEQSLDTKTLILSERGLVHDRVAGLRSGADDYLPKPFSDDEFIERVNAVMRRAKKLTTKRLEIGSCALYLGEALLEYEGEKIKLSSKEAKMVDLLARHPMHILNKERMATTLWTVDKYPSSSSLDTFIKRLRSKLSSTPLRISTRYNLGYELSIQK